MYSKIDQIIILLLLICHLIYIKLYSIYLYGNNPILVYRIKKIRSVDGILYNV